MLTWRDSGVSASSAVEPVVTSVVALYGDCCRLEKSAPDHAKTCTWLDETPCCSSCCCAGIRARCMHRSIDHAYTLPARRDVTRPRHSLEHDVQLARVAAVATICSGAQLLPLAIGTAPSSPSSHFPPDRCRSRARPPARSRLERTSACRKQPGQAPQMHPAVAQRPPPVGAPVAAVLGPSPVDEVEPSCIARVDALTGWDWRRR